MLYLRYEDQVFTYAGSCMLRPTTSCRASCCDVECVVCDEDRPCPHTTHESQGLCVNQLDAATAQYEDLPQGGRVLTAGTFLCLAFFPIAPLETFACECATQETCAHQDAVVRMTALTHSLATGRAAGSLNRRLFTRP